MRSKFIATICIIFLFSTNIKAQDSLKNFKVNTIYFSPFKLINNEVELGIEHKLNRLSSIKFDASLIWLNNNEFSNTFSNYGDEMLGSNLTFSFRKYVFYNQIINKKRSENLWGVYISPMVQYQYLERKSRHETYDINGNSLGMISQKDHQNAFTPGVLTGMRFDLAKGLNIP